MKNLTKKQRMVLTKGHALRIVRGAIGTLNHLIVENDFVMHDSQAVDMIVEIISNLENVDSLLTNKNV